MRAAPQPALLPVAAVLAACGGPPGVWHQSGDGRVLTADPAFTALLAPDARIERLLDDGGFLEGPLWVGDALLYSDLPNNGIYRWAPGRGKTAFIEPYFDDPVPRRGGPNGLALDADGRVVVCEHGGRRVVRIETDGRRTVLAERFQGRRLNSPNDAVYHTDGTLYFTDPPHGLAGEDDDAAKELTHNGIYRLLPSGEIELLDTSLPRPNGIALAPDERTLYVGNSGTRRPVLVAFDVRNDGTLGSRRVVHRFTEGSPDGLKTDYDGNVYVTAGGGVWVFSAAGTLLGIIAPDQRPANVAWGEDGSTLYITARSGLYRLRMQTTGFGCRSCDVTPRTGLQLR